MPLRRPSTLMGARLKAASVAFALIVLAAKAVDALAPTRRPCRLRLEQAGDLMANLINRTITTSGPDGAQYVNYRTNQFGVGIAVIVPGGTTMTATLEKTYDDPSSAAAVWFPFSDAQSFTANKEVSLTIPCVAVRLNVASISGGPAYLKILQADG